MLGTETQRPHTAGVPPRRADYGAVRLGQRDIDGLILCAEHYGAPYDLLAAALGAQPARLRGITARWRGAGYAATGRLGPGPAWCWLTPSSGGRSRATVAGAGGSAGQVASGWRRGASWQGAVSAAAPAARVIAAYLAAIPRARWPAAGPAGRSGRCAPVGTNPYPGVTIHDLA